MNIYGIKREDLEQYFLDMGEKKFKALQVFEWLYIQKKKSFFEMTNIKKEIQEKLAGDFSFDMITIQRKQEDKLTKKYLFKLFDGNFVEAVLMEHDYGTSICVSSEVGCNMGCAFCESGRLKKVRDLGAYEMVQQILLVEADIKKRISSVVIMGIGEPLDNYDNVMNFIKVINDPKGIAIGARHITLSTCGIIPKIKDLSEENLQINLAISLHAANNETRNKIMKINKRYPIEEVMDAVRYYEKEANRRVTFEYILIEGLNDSKKDAIELAKLIKGCLAYVNIIPYNEVKENGYKRSKRIDEFHSELTRLGVNATIRKEFGSDIDAACGQLRAKQYEKERQEI